MHLKNVYLPPTSYKACHPFLTLMACLFTSYPIWAESTSEIVFTEHPHPYLTCNAEELSRLQQAYHSQGGDHDTVAAYVKSANRFLDEPVAFPSRGGQHNQWYQCEKCEIALKTIDLTHHRCPKCGMIYSGPPYDDVIFSQQHGRNLQRMLTTAWAYAISQDQKYVRYAARVLLGYADRYKSYPYHSASLETTSSWGQKAGGHLYEQTLNEASCLATQIGPAYDLIHDSGVLSVAEHNKINEGLLLPMLDSIDKNKAGKSNWQTWHNAAFIWGGALIHKSEWITKAITAEGNGFYCQMDISVSKEGMWYENSWGYHFYTLQALVNMAETARHLDIDLWSDGRLKKMFTLPVYYTMANGMLPRFGDDVNSSVTRIGGLIEPAYYAYQDPQILALLADKRDFQAIQLGRPLQSQKESSPLRSIVFEDAGHAILRTSAPAGLTAAMTFGPYGGFHGHFDKLSFVFFGYADELGVDPGRARSQAYRLPIHTNWYKATISHNTVLVDRKSQKPATGKLRLFECENDYTVVAASCDEAYAGVEHTRWLVMTGIYLLVFDTLQSDVEHRFDWIYHNRGEKIMCDVVRNKVNLADEYTGGEYIEEGRQAVTDDMVCMQFKGQDVTTHLTVAAQDDTTVTLGQGIGASITDRVPMTMIGRNGHQAHFAVVLEPVIVGNTPRVTAIRFTKTNECLSIVVEHGRQADRVNVFPDNKVLVALAQQSIQ